MVVKQVFDLCLREAGKGFLVSLKASNRYSASYLGSLERTIALLAVYSEEQHWSGVSTITTSHLEEYLSYLQDRPRWFGTRETENPRKVSQGYVGAQYRRLNRFFNWLVERGHVESNPLRLIKHPRVDEKTVPVVSEQEMWNLLTLLDPALATTPGHLFRLTRNRAVLITFWDTPGRLNEIASLDVGNVDLEAGTVVVMGKGRKERAMGLGDVARSALWNYLQVRKTVAPRSDSLWVSERGETMQPNWLYLMLKRLGKRAGISNLHTHRFRHSYAINAMRSGMPERILQVAGGWKKIPDTYLRTLDAEDAQQFHRQVSPGDRLKKAVTGRKSTRMSGRDKPRGML